MIQTAAGASVFFTMRSGTVTAVIILLILTAAKEIESTGSNHQKCVPLLDQVQCGSAVPPFSGQSLPSREAEALPGEFPWHAALFRREAGSDAFSYCCGGSLINEWFVLTAAHCLINPNNGFPKVPGDVRVRLGAHELDKPDECVQNKVVREIHVHDGYSLNGFKHDIGLVRFSERAIFTPRVLPVCVDISDTEEPSFYQQYGKVAGWGFTEVDALSDWLRVSEQSFENYTTCVASNPTIFSDTIYEGMFCARYADGYSIGNGDSGGGLVTYTWDRWILQGIASFTALESNNGKKSEEFTGFIKVRYYRKWLKKLLQPDQSSASVNSFDRIEDEVGSKNCGLKKVNKRNLIINGVQSYEGEWPWHVGIFVINGRSKRYACGGTLISDQFVMTAAHCLLDGSPELHKGILVVQLGQNNLHESSVHMREVQVRNVTTHAQFDPISKTNDIALLELTSTVQFDDYMQPACLPKQKDSENLNLLGSSGSIAGWGYQQPWTFVISNKLQSANVSVVDAVKCITGRISRLETAGILCVGSVNGSNACTGDSGGGIFFEKNGVWTVRGVIPALDNDDGYCNPEGYLKVTDTAHFLNWIKQEMKAAVQRSTGLEAVQTETLVQSVKKYPTASSKSTPPQASSHQTSRVHSAGVFVGDPRDRHRYQEWTRNRCREQTANETDGSAGFTQSIKRFYEHRKCMLKEMASSVADRIRNKTSFNREGLLFKVFS
ncbi:transmembrane protease serine 9-like [Uranotaenia lowii]|uniref:transmembrane protease serine 9-like n=1 Tax=Uranotaenia lowii TaxID=190385 RepID=UPI00247ABD02|nr:transmembrane protease serine 9-like [Uranotaenia lowii]